MNTDQKIDVTVIGGGAAGLSAAVTLARSLRSVAVLDAGEPRNAPADGAHNVLARDESHPSTWGMTVKQRVRDLLEAALSHSTTSSHDGSIQGAP